MFLAEQEGFGREAVVKIAHARLLGGRDEEVVRSRFAAELKAATQVNHANVVTLFTAGETADGLPAIAMEYVPGVTLESLLETRAGKLPPAFLHRVFAQFGSAVAAFHHASVIHRDLSPSNIIVGDDERGDLILKVLDFGVAKMGSDPGRTSVVGTPRYMAPEQVVGASEAASDIYALGAILWWALTGTEFQSGVQTLEDVTEARLMGAKPAQLRRQMPDAPLELAALLADLLAFETTQRPTATEFCERWSACRPLLVEDDAPAERSVTLTPSQTSSARPRTARDPLLDCVIFETDHVRAGLLNGFLTQHKCRPRTVSVAEANSALASRPDVVFVSSDLPGAAAGPLLNRVRVDAPGTVVVALISTERQRTAMIRAGADYAFRVPSDLPHLVEYLEEARRDRPAEGVVTTPYAAAPSSTPVLSTWKIESFVGDAPEILADIADALEERHAARARQACDLLRERALEMGRSELAQLSTACAAFADQGDFTTASGFVDQLETEYAAVFQRLINLHADSTTEANR